MPKYRVTLVVEAIFEPEVMVEAKDEIEAEQIANEMFDDGDISLKELELNSAKILDDETMVAEVATGKRQ